MPGVCSVWVTGKIRSPASISAEISRACCSPPLPRSPTSASLYRRISTTSSGYCSTARLLPPPPTGHPLAVVLFAMGGYGTYLGFRIRSSDDLEEKAMAKDLHPKLLGSMFFFFALGATGGIISLLTSDKPILESPHAITGAIGLALLTVQAILPALFEGNSGLRNVHGLLGGSIMTLFLVHAALGLRLGLSF